MSGNVEDTNVSDACKSNDIRSNGSGKDEKLFTWSQMSGKFINDGRNETFQSTELAVQTDEDEHEEKDARDQTGGPGICRIADG